MKLFEWNERYNTGVADIDSQHRKLFEYADSLHTEMKKGNAGESLDSLFKSLLEYVFHHFNFEEELLSKIKYSDFGIHRTEHDNLTKRLLQLRSEFNNGNKFITAEMLTFLKTWLTIHILQTDMKYAQFIKSNNTDN